MITQLTSWDKMHDLTRIEELKEDTLLEIIQN